MTIILFAGLQKEKEFPIKVNSALSVKCTTLGAHLLSTRLLFAIGIV